MCFGKKKGPQPRADPPEKLRPQGESDPRPARSSPPASQPQALSQSRASQPRASDQRPTSRRQSRSSHPVTQGQSHMDSQPREGCPHRARSQDRVDQRQASKRLSGLDHLAAPQGVTPDSDGGILIAVMGVTGKIQSLFKTCIDWLR